MTARLTRENGAVKNDGWLAEDEAALTATEFRKRMRLQAVVLYSGSQFEFYYEDGDMFWGHAILVMGSLESGVAKAEIAG